jgi:intein-encoded DNA endonuclease-like protein
MLFSEKQIFCKPRTGTPYVRIYSKKIATFMEKEFQHPLTSQITWKTPKILIETKNKKFIRWYIAGFWDAEGGFDIRTHQIRFHLSWDGSKCPPLEDIKNFLGRLGIETGKVGMYENKNGNYPRFVLRVSKKENGKFLKRVPISNPSKKKKIGIVTAK